MSLHFARSNNSAGRQACRIRQLARATLWYRAEQRSARQQQLAAGLQALAEAHPRRLRLSPASPW